MRAGFYSAVALALLTAACGSNTEQRAATGAGSGAVAGAVVGGPVGALAGAGIGGAGGAVLDEGVDTKAERAADRAGTSGSSRAGTQHIDRETARQAQSALQSRGFYDGPIDGIVGRKTRSAISAFQSQEGLPRTARLDQATLQHLNVGSSMRGGAGSTGPSPSPGAGGTTTTPSTGGSTRY